MNTNVQKSQAKGCLAKITIQNKKSTKIVKCRR